MSTTRPTLDELVSKYDVFKGFSDTGVTATGDKSWKRAAPGTMFMPDGSPAAWYKVKDGDSLSYLPAQAGGADPNTTTPVGEVETRWQFINDRETAKDGQDGKAGTPADKYANEQMQDSANLLEMCQREGLTIKPVIQSTDTFGRSVVIQEVYDANGNNLGDLSSLKLKYGRTTAFCQPSNTNTTTISCNDARRAEDEARQAQRGIWDPKINSVITKEDIDEKLRLSKSPLRKNTHNKKYGQDERRTNGLGADEYKIGDVYLPVNPTSISISQVRTSYSVPLLGYEAKPTSSYTTRTVVKLQCIFPDAAIEGDLHRILLQFKYCPINLIKSQDLFNKVAHAIVSDGGDNRYISTLQRDYAGTWAVPVTMDEWTIYTIDGHPGAIGAIFQFSLFNYTAYFNDSPLDRVEYFKYYKPKTKNDYTTMVFGKEVTRDYITKHDPRMAELIRRKEVSVPNNDKILYRDKTLNLEDAIHPYNFNVEDDMDITASILNELQEGHKDSSLRLWKISAAVTPSNKKFITEPESIAEWTTKVPDSMIFASLVKSVSIKFENTFGWLPVIGYSQPVAQYIGPGATHVSINFHTEDSTTVSKLLKTYNELAEKDELFGIYDDRYIVSTYLTIFANCEMCSIKDVSANSIPGHPGVTDVNVMLQKTEFAVNARESNPAAQFDEYWGLQRLFKPLKNEAYSAEIQKLLKANNVVVPGGDYLAAINPKAVFLNGIRATTREALNLVLKRLSQIGTFPASEFKEQDNKARTGEDLYKKLEVSSAAAGGSETVGAFITLMVNYIDAKIGADGYLGIGAWNIQSIFKRYSDDIATQELKKNLIYLADSDNKIKRDKYTVDTMIKMIDGTIGLTAERDLRCEDVFSQMKEFFGTYTPYWKESVYAQASGKSIVLKFFGYPKEAAIIMEVLAAGMSPGDNKSQNKKTMEKYSAYWSDDDQARFPAFGVSMSAQSDKEKVSLKNLDQKSQYMWTIGLTYLHLRGRGVSQINDTPDIAQLQKVAKEVNDRIKGMNLDKYTLAKPYAGHRYYPQVENFITPDTLLSMSVGDWFTDSQLITLGGLLNKVGKICNDIKSPISDTPAWKAAFKSWGISKDGNSDFDKMVNDSGPLGVLQAVAYPDLKRDMSNVGDQPGQRKLIGGQVDTSINVIPNAWKDSKDAARGGTKPANAQDQPLSSMSQLFFAKGYFGQAPKIAAQQQEFMQQLIAPQSYLNKGTRLAAQVLHNNLGKACVIPIGGKGMIGAGEATLADMTGGMIENSGGANAAINKTLKYEGAWIINSANIAQMKDPVAGDKAYEGYQGYTSDTRKAMESKSQPSIVFGGGAKKPTYDGAILGYDPLKISTTATTPAESAKYQQAVQNAKESLKNHKYSLNDISLGDKLTFNDPAYSALLADYKETMKTYNLSKSDLTVDTPYTDALTQIMLESRYGEVSSSTKWNLGQKYLMSQMPTTGLQNAFPTYKLYVIKSDTSDYKFYSLDDYYDFRLVQDLMIIRDRNNPVHLLRARVLIDPRYITISDTVKQKYLHDNEARESNSVVAADMSKIDSKDDTLFSMGRVPMRVGMRIALKMGYHTDPRQQDTVFIGTITSLNGNMNSGIYDIECHGDGRELTVPAATEAKEITGINYSEIIATILRANPNVVHFGKVYGTYLERFSREHYVLMALGKAAVNGGPLSAAALIGTGAGMCAIAPMIGASMIAKGVTIAGLTSIAGGTMTYPYSVGWNALADGHVTHKFWAKQDNWWNGRMGELKNWYHGALYDSGKSSSQIAAHLYETYELNNDPVDDNIFAVDIWGTFLRGESLRVNNSRSIWSILQDVKRLYPNYALDVRPYGNRSTIFLGPTEFSYWRTDDPLVAMAPQLMDISNRKIRYDDRAKDAIKMGIERNAFGDVDPNNAIGKNGIAPLIPFQKQHIVTSFGDIVMNGIRATPERGWNEVVLQYGKNANQANTDEEPIIIKANQNIEPGSTKRQFVNADWITNKEQARHYAVGVLKEGVEKMYGGTLVIRGNSKVEPNDRVYVCDKVNKMYGWIEVETVIHKFDQQSGYTTHIVPNMVCSVNSDAYMTTGHITRRLLSEKLGQVTAQNIFSFTAGLVAGTAITGVLASAAPLLVALGGAALMAYAVSDAAKNAYDKSAEIFKNYAIKNDEEFLNSIMETSIKAQLMEESFFGGYALNLLVKAVRFVKSKDAGQAIASAYDYAALYASRGKSYLGNKGTTILNGASRGLIEQIAAKVGADLGRLADGKTTKAQVEDWLKQLEKDPANKSIAEDYRAKIERKGGIEEVLKKATDAAKSVEEREALATAARAKRLASIESKAGDAAKIKGKAGGAVKTGLFLMLLGAIESIPTIVEGFCINAMTNANVIVLHPIWVKNSLLLTGMDGYRTTSAFMHMRDQIMFAKKSLSNAVDAVGDWAPVMYGGSAPELEGSTGLAYANIPSNIRRFMGKSDKVSESEKRTLKSKVMAYANQAGLGPDDVKNLMTMISLETGAAWDTYAHSSTTAVGLFQFTKGTGKQYGLFPGGVDKRTDADLNIQAGIKYYQWNKSYLEGKGMKASGLNIFILHNVGPDGVNVVKAAEGKAYSISSTLKNSMILNGGKSDVKAYYSHIADMWSSHEQRVVYDNEQWVARG